MTLLRLLLLLQVACLPLVGAQIRVPELSISKDESFRIRVIIEDIRQDHNVRYRYQLDEAYSSEQKRTSLKYKILGPTREEWLKESKMPDEGTLIIEDGQRPLLIANDGHDRQWCQEVDWAKFEHLCKIDFLDFLLDKDPTLDNSSPLRGPSGLLFMFEKIRNKLVPFKAGLGLSIHNVPGVKFIHPTDLDSIEVSIYYAKSQVDNGGKALPLRISVDQVDERHIEYDFWSDSRTDREQFDVGVGVSHADELVFDEFFIERAKGCSSLTGDKSDETIAKLVSKQNSFSFQARAPTFVNGRDMLAYVAYYKKLNLMRVDRQTGSRGSNLLIDFKSGKTYRTLAKPKEVPDVWTKSLRSLMFGDMDANRCIVIKSPKVSHNLEKMLLGSKGAWRYLGLARVRGLRARVYEAHDTNWPMWLRQPISYTRNWFHDKNDLEFIHEAHGDSSKQAKLTTVIYLSDDHKGPSGRPSDPELIYMEIFLIHESSHKILQRKSISFFDFAWQVKQLSVWPRASSIFSMAAQCDLEQEVSQHLHVSMVLTQEVKSKRSEVESLSISLRRDLSLIDSLQNSLGIPSSMIHDLESRQLVFEDEEQNPIHPTSISLSFGLAKSKQPLVRLRFYGTGKVKAGDQSTLTSLRAILRDCFYIAAHQKVNTFFAYSEEKSLCVIDLESDSSIMVRGTEVEKPKAFDVFTNGPLNIYFVHHDEPPEEPELVSKLRDLSKRSSESERQLMKRILLPDPVDRIISVSCAIKNFKVTDGYVKKAQSQLVKAEGIKRACNFGLVPDSRLAKVFAFDDDDEFHRAQAMNFHACQTACFIEFNCKAFSICFKGSQVECVLTSIDFNDANLELQMADILKGRSGDKSTREFSLKVDLGETITVKQSANCELHKKSYLDAFRREEKPRQVDPGQLLIEPVLNGPEECARACFDQTLKVILRLEDVDSVVESNLDSITKNFDQLELDATSDIIGVQRKWSRDLCKEFYYLDSANLLTLPTNSADTFRSLMDKFKNDVTGFCIRTKTMEQTDVEDGTIPKSEALVTVDEFSFRFELIYEKRAGIRILDGIRMAGQYEAYKQVTELGQMPSNSSDLNILKELIANRTNSQATIRTGVVDEASCALACTLQTVGPWPSCRSFDMIMVSKGIDEANTICKLNSISYADAIKAKRLKLISTKHDNVEMQWHYEPKFQMIDRYNLILKPDRSSYPTLATCMIFFLGSLTGLAIAVAWVIKGFNLQRSERPLIFSQRTNNDIGMDADLNLAS